jgi:Cupin domain
VPQLKPADLRAAQGSSILGRAAICQVALRQVTRTALRCGAGYDPASRDFIIQEGQVRDRVGDETIDGGPGDIVVGPAGTPHGFTNLGPGQARLVCIHAAPQMKTEWLD